MSRRTGHGGGSTATEAEVRLGGSAHWSDADTAVSPDRGAAATRSTMRRASAPCATVERPTAWAVLTRLMRYMEQPSSGLILRCDATRQAIPLSATHANKMLEARAADSRLAAEEHSDDGGRRRKRRRDESGSRRDERSHKSKHGTDTRHDEMR